ncbi:helix-turn-helix domain-containing protein [Blastomonas sp. CCH1-A6]|uniref:helix-turn-helix domain-containing protein n=1 Tax=Blastomonas sp. CCH1-A6 TaxID=1768762 RepID=UPI0009E7F1A2
MNHVITIAETMRRLSVGRTTVYSLLADGRLKSVKIGRSRRILLESVEALLGGAK